MSFKLQIQSSALEPEGGHTRYSYPNKSFRISVTGAQGKLEWSTLNPKVASVSNTGKVKAGKVGTTRIAACDTASGQETHVTVHVHKKVTKAQAKKALLKLKPSFPDGKKWSNANYYYWTGAHLHCYGCSAFAAKLGDKVFGRWAPVTRREGFARIYPGDFLRIGGTHTVLVLSKGKDFVTVAEGNWNKKIRWGRKITFGELREKGFYTMSRYPG